MAKGLPKEKKDHLKTIGYSDTQLAAIEETFTKAQTAAEESGRQAKEATPPVEGATVVATEPVAETQATEPVVADKEVTPTPLTAAEVAEAVGGVLTPLLERLTFLETAFGTLAKEITTVKDSQDSTANHTIKATPAMSLKELMAQTVYGNPAAVVDGRSSLAKDKPKEAVADAQGATGIPLLDHLIRVNQTMVQQ